MTEKWYCEERRNVGDWEPCLYHGARPPEQRSEGGKVDRRALARVPDHLADKSISEIARAMGAGRGEGGEA